MVLDQSDQGPLNCNGCPIECVEVHWCFAIGRSIPTIEPPSLKVGRVRAGSDLSVALLARDPRLAVVLLRGRRAEVANRDVDDPVGDLESAEDLLLDREQP